LSNGVRSMMQASKFSKEQIKKLYYDMVLIRRFEERAGQLYGRGLIGGFCHLYIGQEAVVVGMHSVLSAQDTVITAYRDHGHMLVCDMDPGRVMAELTGRIDGYSKGKGGSMHMFSREKNFFGGHGIVGAQVALGTGLAFAHHYKNDGGLTVAYMGDGASNQGQVFESMNMASLWKLPIIYVIENNQYAMGTSTKRHAAQNEELYNRGSIFAIPGSKVNGMDIWMVIEAGQQAVEHVRAGKGPYILEMETYRYRGHSMSDPGLYRSKEEVELYREQKDPIEMFKKYVLERDMVTPSDLAEVDVCVKNAMQKAVKMAEDSPEPPVTELYRDVFVGA